MKGMNEGRKGIGLGKMKVESIRVALELNAAVSLIHVELNATFAVKCSCFTNLCGVKHYRLTNLTWIMCRLCKADCNKSILKRYASFM